MASTPVNGQYSPSYNYQPSAPSAPYAHQGRTSGSANYTSAQYSFSPSAAPVMGHPLASPFNLTPRDIKFEITRSRMAETYGYVAGGLLLSSAACALTCSSPVLLSMVTSARIAHPILTFVGYLVTQYALLLGICSTPVENVGARHAYWVLFAGMTGLIVSPLVAAVGSSVALQGALSAVGLAAFLSLSAFLAPGDAYLPYAPLVGMGLCGLLGLSVTAILFGSSVFLHQMNLYVGLVIFSGALFCDSQNTLSNARENVTFDPMVESLSIFLDIMNIAIRLMEIYAQNQDS